MPEQFHHWKNRAQLLYMLLALHQLKSHRSLFINMKHSKRITKNDFQHNNPFITQISKSYFFPPQNTINPSVAICNTNAYIEYTQLNGRLTRKVMGQIRNLK